MGGEVEDPANVKKDSTGNPKPGTRSPKNLVGTYWEYKDLVGIILLYSYYIFGVPCLGFPLNTLFKLRSAFGLCNNFSCLGAALNSALPSAS